MAHNRENPTGPSSDNSADQSHLERREFFKVVAGGVGGVLALGASVAQSPAKAVQAQSGQHHGGMARYGMKHRRHGWTSHSGTLASFVDALPIPGTIAPVGVVD